MHTYRISVKETKWLEYEIVANDAVDALEIWRTGNAGAPVDEDEWESSISTIKRDETENAYEPAGFMGTKRPTGDESFAVEKWRENYGH